MFVFVGGEKTRQFWKHYYSAANAVVFVIDSGCLDSEWEVTQQLFYDAAHNDILRRLPWLVLANCQDKDNARTEQQVSYIAEGHTAGYRACKWVMIHDVTSRDWSLLGTKRDNWGLGTRIIHNKIFYGICFLHCCMLWFR